MLKLPELFGPTGTACAGQALVGALCSAVTAYLAVRFLMRFFETQHADPFAIYCFAAGAACADLLRRSRNRDVNRTVTEPTPPGVAARNDG